MQRGEFLSVDADLQLLDAAVLLPCLTGADITGADYDGGDAGIVGGELIFDPFADAVACLAFHPSSFVGEVGGTEGIVGTTALGRKERRADNRVVLASAIETATASEYVIDIGESIVVFGSFKLLLRSPSSFVILQDLGIFRFSVLERLNGFRREIEHVAYGGEQVAIDRCGDDVLGREDRCAGEQNERSEKGFLHIGCRFFCFVCKYMDNFNRLQLLMQKTARNKRRTSFLGLFCAVFACHFD